MDQEIFHCAHTLTMVFLNIYNDEKDEKKTRIVPFPIIKNLYYKNSYISIYMCQCHRYEENTIFYQKIIFFLYFSSFLYGVWNKMRSRSI